MPLKVPSKPDMKQIVYDDFRGVDFSQDPTLIDRHHASDMLNMISQDGGAPVKRKGWEVLDSTYEEEVNNLWSFYMSGQRWYVAAIGQDIREFKRDTGFAETVAHTNANADGKRAGFFVSFLSEDVTKQGLFILNQTEYIQCVAGEEALEITEVDPYVPTVIISRDPTGAPNAGTVLEDVNLLTRERIEQFTNTVSGGTSTNTAFLCTAEINTELPYSAKYLDSSDGTWKEATIQSVSGATVTLTAAYTPDPTTEDNIRIQYYATGADKSDRIKKCTVSANYNQSTVDQVFVSGNSDFPQYVWYSQEGNPTYFPDLNYLFVGGSGTGVMGFMVISSYLAIVKEQSGQDATVFLIYSDELEISTTDTEGKTTSEKQTIYKCQQASVGIGAISKYCNSALNDEPLFLSNNGIYGMVSTSITSEKVIRQRSRFLNTRLCAEANLDKAIACTVKNYYMLFINDHGYILDGRHVTNDSSGNTNYSYDAYYWDNVPAKCVMTFEGELWFGTADGRICRFKFDDTSMLAYNDDNEPIKATFALKNDNDNSTSFLKTMHKKGSLATFAPFAKSSAEIFISIDGEPEESIGSFTFDIFTFTNIDFSRLTFNSNATPRDQFFGTKIKKYKRLKLIFKNDIVNEGFGIHEVVKSVSYDKYAK